MCTHVNYQHVQWPQTFLETIGNLPIRHTKMSQFHCTRHIFIPSGMCKQMMLVYLRTDLIFWVTFSNISNHDFFVVLYQFPSISHSCQYITVTLTSRKCPKTFCLYFEHMHMCTKICKSAEFFIGWNPTNFIFWNVFTRKSFCHNPLF